MENTLVLVSDDVAQSVASLGILHGAQHAFWLVQRKRDMVRVHAHARTVDTDLLTFRIDSGAKFGNQLAIDLNATIGDDFLAFTARAEARLSEKFLQANAFIVMIVRLGGARICVWHRSPNVAGLVHYMTEERL